MNEHEQLLPEWDDYSGPVQAAENLDKIERPPLTGKNRYVPDGLYDEPWDHVNDAYGKATLTPFYIEALSSDDEGDVQFGVYQKKPGCIRQILTR